jgi:hypothetical protein
MATCDVCGNAYDKTFSVTQGSKTMTFDSFECAIHAMAHAARIAIAASSVTASKPRVASIAAPTAPSTPA